MPYSVSSKALANQIIRSGTSPYANYCAACLAKSDKDFLNKLKMVEEEFDETSRWVELIGESGIIKKEKLSELYNENIELLKKIVSSIVTVINRLVNSKLL
ncbi:MAG: four helix bundle protein [Bacteroidaceae bacterium]|nr:four helix bundle protein [Bacteroidaceae bacterium]